MKERVNEERRQPGGETGAVVWLKATRDWCSNSFGHPCYYLDGSQLVCVPESDVLPFDARSTISSLQAELERVQALSESPVFTLLQEIDEHLDGRVSEVYKEQPLAQDWGRVAKIGEEFGEAIDALIAYTGQNPRKGVCGEKSALLEELADVAMTALLAIQHFTKNDEKTRWWVENKARHIYDRMKAWEAANPVPRLIAGETAPLASAYW